MGDVVGGGGSGGEIENGVMCGNCVVRIDFGFGVEDCGLEVVLGGEGNLVGG